MLNKNIISINNKTILVTGAAGFIGANLILRLLNDIHDAIIIGIDNLNDYYDTKLKSYRIAQLDTTAKRSNVTSAFFFCICDISDSDSLHKIFIKYQPDIVINLAAQAGVRYSIQNPDAYIKSNLIGFYNILEEIRHSYDKENTAVQHFVYASSSSVYGGNTKIPFNENDWVDNPVSLYAATKKSNELLAHSYAKLYNIPSTGLRFFTVYGPAGRPDMAYFTFTKKLVEGKKIKIFNYGCCKRDFTYIDDIVEGIVRVIQGAPKKSQGTDNLPIPPHSIYNIGNSNPENLLDFVQILSEELIRANVLPASFDLKAHQEFVPMQPGDVPITYADTSKLEQDYNFKPSTDLRTGLRNFSEWYKAYYGI